MTAAARLPWGAGTLLLAALLLPDTATSQLRPLEPMAWHTLDAGRSVTGEVGMGLFDDQHASLAGTVGRLLEFGNFRLVWRSGRFALDLGGTVLRTFHDRTRFAPPNHSEGVEPADGPRRRDSGDYRVGTVLALTPPERDAVAVLRFGTRLPTTDDLVGIDRDRTDFFALLGGRLARGPLHVAAEAGLGIHGTRDPRFEQADVLLYSLAGEYRLGHVSAVSSLLGQRAGFDGWSIRGNEDLSELRLGARVGHRYWVQALWVAGLTEFSPRSGWLLSAGTTR